MPCTGVRALFSSDVLFYNFRDSAIGSILTKNGLRVEDVEGIVRFC